MKFTFIITLPLRFAVFLVMIIIMTLIAAPWKDYKDIAKTLLIPEGL